MESLNICEHTKLNLAWTDEPWFRIVGDDLRNEKRFEPYKRLSPLR